MQLDGKPVKVFRAELCGESGEESGTLYARKGGVEAVCGDGKTLLITELQCEGGKRMAASAYLNGRRIAAGTRLS